MQQINGVKNEQDAICNMFKSMLSATKIHCKDTTYVAGRTGNVKWEKSQIRLMQTEGFSERVFESAENAVVPGIVVYIM